MSKESHFDSKIFISKCLKFTIFLTLFLIIALQWLRYNTIASELLQINDEESSVLVSVTLACVCVTCLFSLKFDKLTYGSVLSRDTKVAPQWANFIFAIALLIVGLVSVLAWARIDFISDDAPAILNNNKTLISFVLFFAGVSCLSLTGSIFLRWTIDTKTSHSEKSRLLEDYPWDSIRKIIHSKQLADVNIKNRFHHLVLHKLSDEVVEHRFMFDQGLWVKSAQHDVIFKKTAQALAQEYFSKQTDSWNEGTDLPNLEKYIMSNFEKKLSSLQLSLYTGRHLGEPTVNAAFIRNLLRFDVEHETEKSLLDFFIDDDPRNSVQSGAENQHYFLVKMAATAFFAQGIYSSQHNDSEGNFDYELFDLLVNTLMGDSGRNECPRLSDVGYQISRDFNKNSQIIDWKNYFSELEKLELELDKYLHKLSLYGYTFPDMSKNRSEAVVSAEFWNTFWESLRWSRN